jgi:tetratricopeptide (TPR) repeat protein
MANKEEQKQHNSIDNKIAKVFEFFKQKNYNLSVMEINNNGYFTEILNKLNRNIQIHSIDVSVGAMGGNITWLRNEIANKDNIVVFGWHKIFPEDMSKYKTWAINFNKLTEDFYLLNKKIMFVFSSFIIELLNKHGQAFVQMTGKPFDFREAPSIYKDMDPEQIAPIQSNINPKDAERLIKTSTITIDTNQIETFDDDAKSIFYLNLSQSYRAVKDNQKALQYANTAAEFIQKTNAETQDAVNVYNNLSNIHSNLNQYEKALENANKSYRILSQILSENDPDLAAPLKDIATIYYNLGNFVVALAKANLAVEQLAKTLPQNHLDYAPIFSLLTKIYRNMGDLNQSMSYATKALSINRTAINPNHADIAQNYHDIALVHFHGGDYTKAMDSIQKANDIRQRFLGQYHPSLATGYNNLSNIHKLNGDYQNALRASKKSLEIMLQILDSAHPYVAMAHNHTAFAFFSVGIKHSALGHINLAIEAWEKAHTKGHTDLEYAYKLREALQSKVNADNFL